MFSSSINAVTLKCSNRPLGKIWDKYSDSKLILFSSKIAYSPQYTSEPIFGAIKLYAKEKVRLRKIGKPMNDEFDLLIGVTAIENKLILVTDNVKDFQYLEGIKIENWFKAK
ncbi:MAG: hypothetical protein RL308_1319 [Bacteroidota bacterium]|jgi:hypothetical protein